MSYQPQQMQKVYEKHIDRVPNRAKRLNTEQTITNPSPCPETYAESLGVKPDVFDKGYVMLRTVVPSWLMLTIIVIGGITLICNVPGVKKIIKGLLKGWISEVND